MAINFLLFRGQLNMVESEHNSTKKEGEHRSCSILVAIVYRELNVLDGIANALTEPRYQLQPHSVQHSQRTSQCYRYVFRSASTQSGYCRFIT